MNEYEIAYGQLLGSVLRNGELVKGRNGWMLRAGYAAFDIRLSDGLPLLTGRKMMPAGILGELAAFIRGAEDLATFKHFGCNYWDANAAAWDVNKDVPKEQHKIGQYGGALWRDFRSANEEPGTGVDQLSQLITNLKNDPNSRRHVISAWHPGAKACLPPCVTMLTFQVTDNRSLNLVVHMRSVDLCLGLPSDVAGMAVLLHLLANECELIPGYLTMSLVNPHVYQAHVTTACEYLGREFCNPPTLVLPKGLRVLDFEPKHAQIIDYMPNERLDFEFVV